MRTVTTALAAAGLLVALSGCALGANSADLFRQMDANFANCERHITFQGSVSAISPGTSWSGSIDCKGVMPVPASAGMTAAPVVVQAHTP